MESFLDKRGEFADSATLLAEHFLSMGCANDDIRDSRRNTNFDSRVTFFSQLSLEELVQLSIKDAIGNELSPL